MADTVAHLAASGDAAKLGTPRETGFFAPFEWMLAWRYLRARRREGFVSVIAMISFLSILIGVATLIIVLAVMHGLRKELTAKILGANGHMVALPQDSPFTDYADLVAKMSAVPGVRLVIPYVEGEGFATGAVRGQGTGVGVRGLREADLERLPAIASHIRMGSLDGFDSREGVAIGRRLANNFGVQVGDSITLLGPDGPRTAFGSIPRRKSYPVVAIFEIGVYDLDSRVVLLPMQEAQVFFNQPDQASGIEIYLNDPDRVDAAYPALSAAVQRPMYLTDWRQRNATLFNALEIERNVMFLIVALIVLVAILNIFSGLVMLVKDKTRDIAILRTMGATRGAVMRVFVITGTAIGVIGTLAGFTLGVLVCRNIQSLQEFLSWVSGTQLWDPTVRFLTQIPADMDLIETTVVVVMALGLSVLATIYPSWRAATLDPVEALRYE